jgi:solute carrier family 25 protein 33/36
VFLSCNSQIQMLGTALTCKLFGQFLIKTLFLGPLEVVKTRLQSSNYTKTRNATYLFHSYTNLTHNFSFFKQILREEGFSAMYKGLLPNLVGVAPSKAIYFCTYSTCKRLFNDSGLFIPNTAITHMLSAAFAGPFN